jgi:hypothetical protein
LLTDSPQIDGAADLARRRGFKQSLRVRAGKRYCMLLAIYRVPKLEQCGLCGGYSDTMFLAHVLDRGETIVGEDCCAHRDTPDWSQQVSLVIKLDMLRQERAIIRRAIEQREQHLEQIYSMLADARRLRDAKVDFERDYPESLRWEINLLVKHPRASVVEGVIAWDGDAHATLTSAIAFLRELDHLAFYDDDPDPESDPAGYIKAMASRCERLLATLSAAQERIDAGRLFFAPANLERLPDLLSSEGEREEVRRITAGRRAIRA